MPEPLTRDRRYMPGLDGLRALAVIAVIVYHLGFGWASGGLLGVAVFFTLSGYLITDLLLSQYVAGRLQLREFWLARARRLLPALFVMLVVVSVWVWADDRAQLSVVRGEVFAGGLLHQQLVAELPARVLFRAVRSAVSAQSSLVTCGGGAVLHRLAVAAAARHPSDQGAPSAAVRAGWAA